MKNDFIDRLVVRNDSKIVLLVIDGVGGLKVRGKLGTELQVAHVPNLDSLAERSVCGLLDPVSPGVTPGSGPGHFGLFGYDPLECNVGRGVLAAAGIGFDLTDRDLAARFNFATVDGEGNVVDRRAGRIDTETNKRLCGKLREKLTLGGDAEVFIETVKEHRGLLVLRGETLSDAVADTDPQKLGVPPLPPEPLQPEAKATCALLERVIARAGEILKGEPKANALLLRGFAKHRPFKSVEERFGLRAAALANYPMYRGVARLLGMELCPVSKSLDEQVERLKEAYGKHDFFFFHVKDPDARGEDGDFNAKVKALERIDAALPALEELKPDVLVVTGDHSTPAALASHSWHPVPAMLHAATARVDRVDAFDEIACIGGGLGRMESIHLMPLALAHAGRLAKFGA